MVWYFYSSGKSFNSKFYARGSGCNPWSVVGYFAWAYVKKKNTDARGRKMLNPLN